MIITSHMQKNYSNLSMFTEVIAKQDTILKIGDFGWVLTWKYLKQGVWGNIYIYIRGLHSVQSGVLSVYYSDHAAIYSILQ
jgi:calcineurin-like phosphoesterase family protein